MAKIVANPYDDRQVLTAEKCLRAAAKKAPRGSKITLNRQGYPTLTFRARGEAAYYKVFDPFETCLHRHRSRGEKPCTKFLLKRTKNKKKYAECRAKQEKIRSDDLAKLKKKYRAKRV